MRLVILALSVSACGSLAACGHYEAPKAEEKPMEKPSMEISYPAPQPREVVTEYRKDGAKVSRVVDTSADMEACDNRLHGQSVLVRSSNVTLECHGPSATWLEVPEDKKPEAPVKEEEKPAPRALSANEWRDPVTGLVWLLGAKAPFALLEKACEGDYRVPKRGAVEEAVLHGLAIESAWTGDLDLVVPKDKARVLLVAETPKEESRDQGESHSLLCVEVTK